MLRGLQGVVACFIFGAYLKGNEMTTQETQWPIGTRFNDKTDTNTTVTIVGKPVEKYTYFDTEFFYPVVAKRIGLSEGSSYERRRLTPASSFCQKGGHLSLITD